MRCHGEEVKVLTTDENYDAETGILYFTTDQFSDYALIMSPKTTPNTGLTGSSDIVPIVAGLVVLAVALASVVMIRKRNHTKIDA